MKRFRRFSTRRRRRRLPETYTRKACRACFNLFGDSTCSNPHIDIFELLSMATPRNTADPTEVTNPSSKAIVFDGMKFQSEFFHDPLTTQGCSGGGPSVPIATNLAFILTIWEAVVLLPLLQGSTVAPAYLPNLVQGIFQEGDTADRVLWKRVQHLFIEGTTAVPAINLLINPDSTLRYQGSGPVVVKSKCRIDDRHALYYVRNFVHDIFFGFQPVNPCVSADCDACLVDPASCGLLPVTNDFYAKIFYHVRG